ncbi:MFS transporter [Cysteiniphilum sp. 6C5]|uniref:MFS transporter n=1 Tax=unclassified Cysteiniphilum TaxID=2610889 RepID=UPI003F860877
MAIYGQLLSIFKIVFVTVISSLFFCYWLVQLSLFNVLQPYYIDKFEITNYGVFLSSYLLANLVMCLPAGFIVERFPIKIITLLGLAMFIVANLILYLTNMLLLAYFALVIMGTASAFTLTSSAKLLSMLLTSKQAQVAIASVISIAFISAIVSGVSGGFLYAYLGSGNLIIILNLTLGAVLFLVVSVFYPSLSLQRSNQVSLGIMFKKVLSNKINWYVWVYMSIINFPFTIIAFSFGQSLLRNFYNYNPYMLTIANNFIIAGFIIGGPVFNFLLSKYSYGFILYPISAIGCIVACIALLNELPYIILMIDMFLIGVFASAQMLGYATLLKQNSDKSVSAAVAMASLIITLGSVVNEVSFGTLSVHYGYYMAFIALILMLSITIVVGVLISLSQKTNAL